MLSEGELNAIKSLQNTSTIVIQRPDKGGGVVVLNKTDYINKLNDLIGDIRKFKECAKDQSQIVKGKINEIIKEYKSTDPALHKTLVRSGDFYDGHLYGLPKLHKNKEDPPLRPIVSMSGTVTHDLAQYLNQQIRPFINKTHIILN